MCESPDMQGVIYWWDPAGSYRFERTLFLEFNELRKPVQKVSVIKT